LSSRSDPQHRHCANAVTSSLNQLQSQCFQPLQTCIFKNDDSFTFLNFISLTEPVGTFRMVQLVL